MGQVVTIIASKDRYKNIAHEDNFIMHTCALAKTVKFIKCIGFTLGGFKSEMEKIFWKRCNIASDQINVWNPV